MRNRIIVALVVIWSIVLIAPPTPVAQEGTPTTAAPDKPKVEETPFFFGTYGRVGITFDAEGSRAKPLNVIVHGPRLEEQSYLELDLGYKLKMDELEVKVITTLAFSEELFHYNGQWQAGVALRNLFAEARNIFTKHLAVWVGSRMYRGDDIYLFDYWPLDNLNTVGGGFGLLFGPTEVWLHTGVNRLVDDFQFQSIDVPKAGTQSSEQSVVLDRQRMIISLKAVHHFFNVFDQVSMKIKLYGEFHRLPAGTLVKQDTNEQEVLPSDLGWVIGAQFGSWGCLPHSFTNIFVRYAGGLAAYGEMGVPFGVDNEKKSSEAREFVVAASGNYEYEFLGVMLGAYLRYFKDADRNLYDFDDYWEYIIDVRPHFFITDHFYQVFEISYQGRWPSGLDPETDTHEKPGVFKASIIPTIGWEKNTYSRPQFRLFYTISVLNDAARRFFPQQDPRRAESVQHYIGIQVEWWYNSSYR